MLIGGVALAEAGSAGATTKTTKSVAAHGAPIKIFSIGIINSPIVSYPGQEAGEQGAVAAINASGGVGLDHHPLQLNFCDSEFNANQDAVCAQQAIADKAVAVVGNIDVFSPVTDPTLAAAGIPVVAPIPVYASDFTNPDVFPLTGGANFDQYAGGWALKKFGATKVAIVVDNTAVAEAIAQGDMQGVTAAGGTNVGTISVPAAGAANWTPYAEQLANLHAQGVIIAIGGPQAVGLEEAYAQLGGSKLVWMGNGTFAPADLKSCGSICDGNYQTEISPPITDTSNPTVAEFLRQMKKEFLEGVGGAAPDNITGDEAINPWAAVYAFKDLLAHTSGLPTAAKVLAVLRSPKSKNINVQGLFNWSPGEKGPISMFPDLTVGTIWVTEVKNSTDTLLGTKAHPAVYNLFKELHLK